MSIKLTPKRLERIKQSVLNNPNNKDKAKADAKYEGGFWVSFRSAKAQKNKEALIEQQVDSLFQQNQQPAPAQGSQTAPHTELSDKVKLPVHAPPLRHEQAAASSALPAFRPSSLMRQAPKPASHFADLAPVAKVSGLMVQGDAENIYDGQNYNICTIRAVQHLVHFVQERNNFLGPLSDCLAKKQDVDGLCAGMRQAVFASADEKFWSLYKNKMGNEGISPHELAEKCEEKEHRNPADPFYQIARQLKNPDEIIGFSENNLYQYIVEKLMMKNGQNPFLVFEGNGFTFCVVGIENNRLLYLDTHKDFIGVYTYEEFAREMVNNGNQGLRTSNYFSNHPGEEEFNAVAIYPGHLPIKSA